MPNFPYETNGNPVFFFFLLCRKTQQAKSYVIRNIQSPVVAFCSQHAEIP